MLSLGRSRIEGYLGQFNWLKEYSNDHVAGTPRDRTRTDQAMSVRARINGPGNDRKLTSEMR